MENRKQPGIVAPQLAGRAFHPFLPSQIRDVWYHSRAVTPERALGMAVIARALIDLDQCRSPFIGGGRVYRQAYEWVASNERSWPFSFLNLCDMLRLSPSAIRARWLKRNGEQA